MSGSRKPAAASRRRPSAPLRERADVAGDVRALLRLNELRSEAALHEFVIDAAIELSGAKRVLIVQDDAGGLRLAASLVPRGEDEHALLRAVTPWLDEARATRAARLRHGPKGAGPIDQRRAWSHR